MGANFCAVASKPVEASLGSQLLALSALMFAVYTRLIEVT